VQSSFSVFDESSLPGNIGGKALFILVVIFFSSCNGINYSLIENVIIGKLNLLFSKKFFIRIKKTRA
jgi:hypothetical protein